MNAKPETKKMSLGRKIFLLSTGVILIIAVYAAVIIAKTWPISVFSIENSGMFGDSFGLLTALFSGLAFGGLILTLLTQREELQLQRDDIQLQRDELRLTRDEIKNQNFESTFFQMLRLHNDIVNSINYSTRIREHTKTTSGRSCFVDFSSTLRTLYTQTRKAKPDSTEISTIQAVYGKFWPQHQHHLGHYFRYLYRIFKFINDRNPKDKILYSGIARAQLSDQELLLLYYNCLTSLGDNRFKPLAEEFALFDNLPPELLFSKDHKDLYAPSAWGA